MALQNKTELLSSERTGEFNDDAGRGLVGAGKDEQYCIAVARRRLYCWTAAGPGLKRTTGTQLRKTTGRLTRSTAT